MSVSPWHVAGHGGTEIGYFQQTCALFQRPEVGSGLPDRAAMSKSIYWRVKRLLADVIWDNCSILECNK